MERILLVEDDEQIVAGLSDFLRSEGFVVDTASGQKQALAKMEKSAYDLMLLDISLSDGNGYAICAAAKASGDTAGDFSDSLSGRIQYSSGIGYGGGRLYWKALPAPGAGFQNPERPAQNRQVASASGIQRTAGGSGAGNGDRAPGRNYSFRAGIQAPADFF